MKFDFLKNICGWRYSTVKNLQYSKPFSPKELYLEVSLSVNEGNYLSIRRWVIILKVHKQRIKNFNLKVDQSFLKICTKSLVKVTIVGEVMGRKRPTTLRNISFLFHHSTIFLYIGF